MKAGSQVKPKKRARLKTLAPTEKAVHRQTQDWEVIEAFKASAGIRSDAAECST